MKRRAFIQNKLWRDRVVEKAETQGSILHRETLTDEAFDRELRLKLLEEAQEVQTAKNQEELTLELADVLEVIETLGELHGLSMDQIRAAQIQKRNERGGFNGRQFVSIAEHLDGSFLSHYCLKDPAKYPEVSLETT